MSLKYFFNPMGGGQKIEIDTTPIRFDYTGAVQTYTVPKGCKKLHIDCCGAKGTGDRRSYEVAGKGGRVECVLKVTPNQILYLYVGQAGVLDNDVVSFNGGGAGGSYNTSWTDSANGGGASDIRTVPASSESWYLTDHESWKSDQSLLSRLVVAGGGGGVISRNSRYSCQGGDGGGLIGKTGTCNGSTANSGTGGTQTEGGTNSLTVYTDLADFGKGTSGNFSSSHYWGLGGGGGYYGGGCGTDGAAGGGGGGSSYTHPDLCSEVIHTQGYNNGNGYIIITPLEK